MNEPRVITSASTREDEAIEASIRPKKLDDYLQINMEENEPHYAGAIQFSKQVLK